MKAAIAKSLLDIGAVKFSVENPFLYASGLSGPIYCDNRLILSHVVHRDLVIESFIKLIEQRKPSFDIVGGIATAGIPHAAFIADRIKAPMVYVRSKAKDHGRKNQVEGDYVAGQKVLLFEDLVNQGSSLDDAMAGLKGAGLLCDACFSIVDYEMPAAQERLSKHSIQLYSLTNFTSLIEEAQKLGYMTEAEVDAVRRWHRDPKAWSKSI